MQTRKLQNTTKQIYNSLNDVDGTEPISKILSLAEKPILDFTNSINNTEEQPVRLGDNLLEYIEHLKSNNGKSIGISSGFFRYGDVAIAIATTAFGRYFADLMIKWLGDKNILVDTDGDYIEGWVDVDELNKKLNDYIEKEFKLKSHLKIEMEGPYPKAYFLKMKNYVLLTEDNRIIKHGNSFKGSNKNKIFSSILDKLINNLLTDSPLSVSKIINDDLDRLRVNDNIIDFIMKTKINKTHYKSDNCIQMQVKRQAEKFHNISIMLGDMIEYVKQVDGYVIRELANIKKIDKNYYLKQFSKVFERLGLNEYKINNYKTETQKTLIL